MEERKPSWFRRATMGTLNFAWDIAFITLMLFLLLFAGYARWDSQQVYTQADPIQYLQYKPSPPEMMPFEELQAINPDVLGWLTVYDTNIDYPLVKAETNNDFYLTKNPKLESESSGSIFMDYRNHRDFSDFNTIIYGHHMAHHEMFGDIALFLEEDFWNSHEYGNLIFDSKNHGIQFIAMLQCDGYDWSIYSPDINGEENRIKYINHIYETAKYVRGVETNYLRDLQNQEASRKKSLESTEKTDNAENSIFAQRRTSPLTSDDKLVLLSTCSVDTTNGRFILVAKILDHPVENPYPDTDEHKVTEHSIDTAKITARLGKLSVGTWILILVLLIILVLILYILSTYLYKKKLEEEKAYDQNNEEG